MKIEPVTVKLVSELDTGTLFYASILSSEPLLCISALRKGQSADERFVVPFIFPGEETSAFTALDESLFSSPVVVLNEVIAMVDESSLTNDTYSRNTRGMIFSDGKSVFVPTFLRGIRGGLLDLETGVVGYNGTSDLVGFSKWCIVRTIDEPETIAEFATE